MFPNFCGTNYSYPGTMRIMSQDPQIQEGNGSARRSEVTSRTSARRQRGGCAPTGSIA